MNYFKQIAVPIEENTAELSLTTRLLLYLVWTLTIFLMAESIIKLIDPLASILDLGILTVLLFGILAGFTAIFCSFWLQELLWQPFKTFRKQFTQQFNQLTSWQQCILYFSVFFLLLYAVLVALMIVF